MKKLQDLFRNKGLLLIWLIFVCKGLFYIAVSPIWEGFDEYAHFAFIQHLDTYKALPLPDTRVSKEIEHSLAVVPLPWSLREWDPPIITHDAYWQLPPQERARLEHEFQTIPPDGLSEQRDHSLFEGTQGPLYYLLMAPVYRLIRDSPLPTRVFIFRSLNILIGSAIIPIAFVTARKVFADARLAVAVGAVIASMPVVFIDSARVGNQTLAMVEYGVLTWCCLAAIQNRKYFLLAGVILGTLLVTKAYGLAAIPAFMVVGLEILRQSPLRRLPSLILVAVSSCFVALISGWWFLRNLRVAGKVIWIGGAPKQDLSIGQLLSRISEVNWTQLLHSLLDSHTWIGNWSFLMFRSWMYHAFNYWGLLVIAGIIFLAVKQFRTRVQSEKAASMSSLLVLVTLWFGFVVSLMYHGLMMYLNDGIGATAGWYLYAVIVPEAVLIVAGLSAFRFSRSLILGLIACSILVEVYASNWILIPYYSGLIRHSASGGLQAFAPKNMAISISELATRLTVNRPPFITGTAFAGIWAVYLVASIGLFFVALKNFRQS